MKPIRICLALLLALPVPPVDAAYQSFSVKVRQPILDQGRLRCEVRRPSYSFLVQLISDEEGLKSESYRNGKPFVAARPEERYAVRLFNPLPVRVAVNLTVDGLNSISGKPSGISDGQKWMIDPYSSITIRGWQVNGGEARRFFFTPKPKSYAQWRGDQLGKDLAANCGVIGAAYFWSQKELDAYYQARPEIINPPAPWPLQSLSRNDRQGFGLAGKALSNRAAGAPAESSVQEDRAGTGMGERESHATVEVAFDYDTGMYRPSQAVVVYYDFAEMPAPNPFPALSYAPEMP